MKRIVTAIFVTVAVASLPVLRAGAEEPQTYTITKGDTLWGLSERFMKDPYYWPDLWAKNPKVTNPHFIFPGQRLKIYDNRIEVVDAPEEKKTAAEPTAAAPLQETAKETVFTITGGEGFLMEKEMPPAGMIISTYQNRQIIGTDDIVYTNLGRATGGKVGDRYSIFKKSTAISHPVTNEIIGHKVIPLGTLQITELEDRVSKAIITESFMEIGPGSFLGPYAEKNRSVALKVADRDLIGRIVETKTGNNAIAAGDIAYLDLGARQGITAGNMVYAIRDVQPDPKFISVPVGKLPPEVIGALVVVETGPNTSTALVVKSIDTIYRNDRVELIKSR